MDTSKDLHLSSQLLTVPLFASCPRSSISRLLPLVSERSLKGGEALYDAGAAADTMFYVLSGAILLTSGERILDRLESGFVGEEGALAGESYMASAKAERAATLLVFSARGIADFLKNNPDVRTGLYHSLINHSSNVEAFTAKTEAKKDIQKQESLKAVIGWLLAIVSPFGVYFLGQGSTLSESSIYFFMIFSAAGVMWVFRLLPEFVPALFIIMSVLVLGLVPRHVVLAGYSSASFFMALSVFGLGAVLVQSGLTYRLALMILKNTPQSGFFYTLSVLGIGIFLTPLLPSANGRVALVAPLLPDVVDILGYRKKGRAATMIAAAFFSGVSLFSAVFLTSKSINFVLYGLLPAQVKDQFTWGYWTYSAGVAALVLFVCLILLSLIFFRSDEKAKVSKGTLEAQLRILGPWSLNEWIAVLAVVLFIAGVITSSTHKIQPAWIGLAALSFLLILGTISKKGFRNQIDWPFLLMLGGFVGLVKTMSFLEIDLWISSKLVGMGPIMNNNFALFVLLLGIAIYIIRLLVPNSAAVVLIASIFMPIAISQGINPWLIVFIVLIFSDGWIMPYQCPYYLMFEEITESKGIYDGRKLLQFNIATNLLRFAAVYASIPFWRFIGIL